jgi:ketosteroid isomerase-like protein
MLNDSQISILNLPDQQQIDTQISMMLGAWQVGDTDKMHTYYADDVLVVSGGPQPPISGWANYVLAYQSQRGHMSSVRLDRSNTFTKVTGNTAWSTYQWNFNGLVDGKNTAAQGHTTLALEKRDGHWLIVLNHTSLGEGVPTVTAPKTGTP